MKRYFHVSVKAPSGSVVGPKGITASPDPATGRRADQVAIDRALAVAGDGYILGHFQDLGPVDYEC